MESHLNVSDAGLPAPLIGTRRISIADSPESLVNILTTRMPDYRGSGPSRCPGEGGGFPAHFARVGRRPAPCLWTTSRKQFATLELKPSLSEEAGRKKPGGDFPASKHLKPRGRAPGYANFHFGGETKMCILCEKGFPQNHTGSQLGRREFLKASTAPAAAAAGMSLFAARPAAADVGDRPVDGARRGGHYVIRDGHVTSMDAKVGDFVQADVLVEGKKILKVGPNLNAGNADVIDASGRIVMPGFIDTHHHQFETALRSFLANGVLINDQSGSASANPSYFEYILLTFAPVYRPEDVYIIELFGGLSQLDDRVTTVHDVSQIHHSPAHSDAAIQALFDTGRRAAFGYFESAGGVSGNQYPADAPRIKKQWFSSNDQLVHMIMGGEVYLGDATADQSWTIGRQLDLQIAAHILSPFSIRPIFDRLTATPPTGGNGHIGIGADNLFIHMTGMSDAAWKKVKDAAAQGSIAFPIEMTMRHGMRPIITLKSLGMSAYLDTYE